MTQIRPQNLPSNRRAAASTQQAGGSGNKRSRLLLLGALMAVLYGLFAALALTALGGTNGAGRGDGSNVLGSGSSAHGMTNGVPASAYGDGAAVGPAAAQASSARALRSSGVGAAAASGGPLAGGAAAGAAMAGAGAGPAAGAGAGGTSKLMLGGRAMRRNFEQDGGSVGEGGEGVAANLDGDEDGDGDGDGSNELEDEEDEAEPEAGIDLKERRAVVKPAEIAKVTDDDEMLMDENGEGDKRRELDDDDNVDKVEVGGANNDRGGDGFGLADGRRQQQRLGDNAARLKKKDGQQLQQQQHERPQQPPPILKAYVEPIYQSDWKIKPLPVRNSTASVLRELAYPNVQSCAQLPAQLALHAVNDPPTDLDPFLPWIHDVFPTADGKFVQFVAQNRRRCQSGTEYGELKAFMQPNVALFQHVPVKRIQSDDGSGTSITSSGNGSTRYRLSSHEDADPDGIETRFICRFHTHSSDDQQETSSWETLSVFNFDYDYHTYRKMYKSTFTEDGFDNHMIWSSQHLFKCPVPENLVDAVRTGESVVDDYATLFVDLIPIRTPPRYGYPTQFMQPRYKESCPKIGADDEFEFDPEVEWGKGHVLPTIEDSGRWENLPICGPSLQTYVDGDRGFGMDGVGVAGREEGKDDEQNDKSGPEAKEEDLEYTDDDDDEKRWRTIACTWTSATFHTRGERRHVTDNVRRLREWAEFHLMTGFDHIVIYDNSDAQEGAGDGDGDDDTKKRGLEPVADLFHGQITRINWPSRVCNNRPGTGDNKGERSSQYAAEMSCRLRFGPHTTWLGSFDIDEYLVPMGEHESMGTVLDEMDRSGIKILSFQSMRSWPRLDLLEDPDKTKFTDAKCKEGCFHPKVREDLTFLQTYNCDQEKPPRKKLMPAEKQIYRTDFVLLHFVHYSTVTKVSVLSKDETERAGYKWRRAYKFDAVKVSEEQTLATMLHSKSVVWDQTRKWQKACKLNNPAGCKVGFPFPPGKDRRNGVVRTPEGYTCNCFVNENIEKVWVPKLEEALRQRGQLAIA